MRTVVMVALGLAVCVARAAEPIAVNPLKASGVEEGEALALQNMLRAELGESGVYDVMERSQMESILREQGFQQSGACSEASCAVEMGQLLAVKYMVLGSVGRVGKTYSLNVRLVDVATGQIVREVTETHKGSPDALLTKVVPLAAARLAGVEHKRKGRAGKVILISGAVVAVAVAVPVIIIATGEDSSTPDNSSTELTVTW